MSSIVRVWMSRVNVELELLVDLVAPHLGEVVALGVEEEPVDEVLRVLQVDRLPGPLPRKTSSSASSLEAVSSRSSVFRTSQESPKRSRISSGPPIPRAFKSTVTGSLRLRSMRTDT